jgi:hypothetical protein
MGQYHSFRMQRILRIALVLASAYVAWIFVSREGASRHWVQQNGMGSPEEFARTYFGSDVKILQFYARDGVVTEGGKTVICYGVVNAKSVKISPPVEGVGVAINRCVDAMPEHDTAYTLTAEGTDGRTVSASLTLRVEADQETLPQITSFRIAGRKQDYLGRPVFLLSYADRNGEEVSIDPPVFQTMHHAPIGQVYVAPTETTTYTLTVKGKHGHVARKQLTVEMPAK